MGTPTVARQLMEMRQAQAKIDNSINDSGLTGSYNNAPTLAQKKFDHQVSQDAFTNKLNVGDLMGIYEGLPTLTKQALAIKDAQFKAKLAQSQQQFNSSLAAQTAADRSENSGIPSRPTNVSGNVASWLQQALEATGQSADMLPYLATIVQHESGGNPTAVNDWDSNAKAGHPSKGLMQTIDSTFNTYAMPGHGDIWNPVDNAIAAIRYAVSRYGSLENVPGIQSLARGGKYIGY
jgi:SLT domain proteins